MANIDVKLRFCNGLKFDKRLRIGFKSGKKNRGVCEKSWKNRTCNWSGATHCRNFSNYKIVRIKIRGKHGNCFRNCGNNIRRFKHCFYTEKEKCESLQIFEPVVHSSNRVRILLECGERRRRKRLERSHGHSTDNKHCALGACFYIDFNKFHLAF